MTVNPFKILLNVLVFAGLFGLGLFGSRSSSASTSVQDTDAGTFSEIEGDAVYVSGSNNTLSDHGAIEQAFKFAGANQAAVTSLHAGFATGLREFAETATKGESERLVELAKWGVGALVAVKVAAVLWGKK